jgi:hypothetical protein
MPASPAPTLPSMWLRRAVLIACGALALSCLGGCTVPIGGIAAIGVDESGRPVGYLLMCGGEVDGASVYHHAAPSEGSTDETIDGTWDAPGPVTGLASWSLGAPADGWSARAPLGELAAGQTYSLYGWSEDNDWSTVAHDFTVEDLAALHPGEVAFTEPGSDDGESVRVVPVSEFTTSLCGDLDL